MISLLFLLVGLFAGISIGLVVYWYIDVQEHDRAALEERFRKWLG